jgi:glutamine amidotransferase
MSVRATIVAAGGANFGSLREACRRAGVETEVSADPSRIRSATHVLLPGVGAAAQAMRALRAHGLDRVLATLTQPVLGICLGMQLLFEHSAEGDTECLGLLPGRVQRLPAAPRWPHMGWNTLHARAAHPLLASLERDAWFYFVHGYAAADGVDAIATSDHGGRFAAFAAREHVHGVQFHPEKSAAAGRRLLQNFFSLA